MYQIRRESFETGRRAAHRRWSLVANLRLAVFAAAAVAAWFALRRGDTGWWIATAGLLVVAIALVAWHTRLRRERDHLASLVTVNDLALARYRLDWERLPAADERAPVSHPYARDLDVTGPSSLVQRLSTPVLPTGRATLRRWLLATAVPEDIRRRQEAVRELGPRLDLRQRVEAAGRSGSFPDPEPFLDWCDDRSWMIDKMWLRALAIASPLALVILAALFFTGVVTWPWWLIPIAINVVVSQLTGGRVAQEIDRVAPARDVAAGYAGVFRAIGDDQPEGELLREISAALDTSGGAGQRMRSLMRIANLSIPRGSILWLPLQLAFLWDHHVLVALERWRRDTGSKARTWFARAGEWEALAALSVLAHDFPAWCFPDVDPGHDRVEAREMVHPLIAPGEAVANDVAVGPAGSFLFVTGSNMSGKSTLLRAIGINAVLGLAGAPVGARSFTMPPVSVWTCMRVEDSLDRGVSFFMAELQRLKAVVDAADGEDRMLYLLDEILQGTNTAERQVASRQVLAHLATTGSIGAVSSHDLDLVRGTALSVAAVPVHFAETFTRDGDRPDMTFDYRLRPGIATTTNALALMELLGFPVSDGDG